MLENKVGCFRFGEFILDINNGQLLINSSSVSLTQKSFEILVFLIENHGRILKKEEFLEALWEGSFVEQANLTQHIYMLRKTLRKHSPNETFIETIPKNGYRFVADVEKIDSAANPVGSQISENAIAGQQYLSKVSGITMNGENGAVIDPTLVNSEKNFSRGSMRGFALLLGLILTVITVAGYSYFTKNVSLASTEEFPDKSIAVLPFKQIDDIKDAKLGIGVADVLIARLANLEKIKVRPTTSILGFSGDSGSDLFSVGSKLGVDCVINGTIQREKGSVRVTANLFDVKSKRTVWTEKFDEDYSDIFTLQDKISEKIAQRISLDMSSESALIGYKHYTNSAAAYRAYSMGLSYWSMHTKAGFENAIKYFNRAIKQDPKFVMAHAYIADTYGHSAHLVDLFSQDEARAKGEEAAKRALELDPNCAEAMASLALIYAGQDRRVEAFKLMKRSLEIKPGDAHSRHRIAWMYANRGDIDRAVSEMRLARALDPESAYLNLFLGEILILAHRSKEAVTYFNKTLEIEPTSFMATWRLAEALEQQGLHDDAEKKFIGLQKTVGKENKSVRLALSRVYAKNNKKTEARKVLNQVLSEGKTDEVKSLVAKTFIALGEQDRAIENLRPVVESINDDLYRLKYEPNLDPIRGNPAFVELYREKENSQRWIGNDY